MLGEVFRARLTAGQETPTLQILVRIQCPEPMLSNINLDIQANDSEDFGYFKTLFLRNIGIEQMMYNFYLGDVMVRLQISGFLGAQLVGIAFFHYSKVENSVSLEQFNPISDMRFQNFEPIINLWAHEPNNSWGYFRHFEDEGEIAFERIREILNIVNKVNKLKAFL